MGLKTNILPTCRGFITDIRPVSKEKTMSIWIRHPTCSIIRKEQRTHCETKHTRKSKVKDVHNSCACNIITDNTVQPLFQMFQTNLTDLCFQLASLTPFHCKNGFCGPSKESKLDRMTRGPQARRKWSPVVSHLWSTALNHQFAFRVWSEKGALSHHEATQKNKTRSYSFWDDFQVELSAFVSSGSFISCQFPARGYVQPFHSQDWSIKFRPLQPHGEIQHHTVWRTWLFIA